MSISQKEKWLYVRLIFVLNKSDISKLLSSVFSKYELFELLLFVSWKQHNMHDQNNSSNHSNDNFNPFVTRICSLKSNFSLRTFVAHRNLLKK